MDQVLRAEPNTLSPETVHPVAERRGVRLLGITLGGHKFSPNTPNPFGLQQMPLLPAEDLQILFHKTFLKSLSLYINLGQLAWENKEVTELVIYSILNLIRTADISDYDDKYALLKPYLELQDSLANFRVEVIFQIGQEGLWDFAQQVKNNNLRLSLGILHEIMKSCTEHELVRNFVRQQKEMVWPNVEKVLLIGIHGRVQSFSHASLLNRYRNLFAISDDKK